MTVVLHMTYILLGDIFSLTVDGTPVWPWPVIYMYLFICTVSTHHKENREEQVMLGSHFS